MSKLIKCPACGFEHVVGITESEVVPGLPDRDYCRAWAYSFLHFNARLPSKNEFEAMQREKFLPTHGGEGERKWKLTYGHYGWAVDYDWSTIAFKIMETIKARA